MNKPTNNWGISLKHNEEYINFGKIADWQDGGRTITFFKDAIIQLAKLIESNAIEIKDNKYINVKCKKYENKDESNQVTSQQSLIKDDDCPF